MIKLIIYILLLLIPANSCFAAGLELSDKIKKALEAKNEKLVNTDQNKKQQIKDFSIKQISAHNTIDEIIREEQEEQFGNKQ